MPEQEQRHAHQARRTLRAAYGASVLTLAADLAALAAISTAFQVRIWEVATFALCLLLLDYFGGLYRNRLTLSALDDAPALAGRALVAAGVAFGLSYLLHAIPPDSAAVAGAAFIPSDVLARATAYWIIRSLRKKGVLEQSALIVGAGRVGCTIAGALRDNRAYGLFPVGMVDASPLVPPEQRPVDVVGPPSELAALVQRLHVDMVVIAFTGTSESELVSIVRTADRMRCSIVFVTRLFELTGRRPGTDEIRGIPVIPLRRAPFRTFSWRVKRATDIAFSLSALVVLSPLLVLLAAVSRLVDGPGVIFRQERVGLDGYSFSLLKFRSLRRASATESATTWSIKNDDRISWFGRFLRRSSLDELPQLLNILNGDMSLVGPRPERPHFVEQFAGLHEHYSDRHRVPSGLTGWAQVHGLRGDTSIAERARFDNYYIENWSLWLDFQIIIRTALSVFRGSG